MKKILFVSHTFIGGPFVVGSHHLAQNFSKLGHKVIHISTPITPIHYFKRDSITKMKIIRSNQVNKINDNLIDFIPFAATLPWSLLGNIYRKFGNNITISMSKYKIRTVIKEFFGDLDVDYLIIDQPTMVGIEKIVHAKKIVYRATDLYSEMMNDSSILIAESNIIKNSDGLIATSKPVLEHITNFNNNIPSLVIENGVDFLHFSHPQEMPSIYKELTGVKAIYAGAIDERLDLNAIIELAKSNLEIHVIIIGPLNDNSIREKYSTIRNLHFLGAINYTCLPAYLQHADIALLPLSNHTANNGRSPMKLYEYLATGLPVLTKKTDELVNRDEDYVFFYEDIKDKANEVISLNIKKETVQKNIEKYSWEQKAKKVLNFIGNL